MATITSTPTGGTLTANKNKEVQGTISWSKPTVPSGATISSCVLTGKATASMNKGSVTITVNGTTVTSGSTFTINLGTANDTTSVSTSIKGTNNQASGSVSFSELLYTVTYTEVVYDIMVAEYKFDNTIYDLFPEFNEGFAYTYEDVVEGNVTTRTIYSDSLPTLMRFGTNILYANDYVKGSEVALISIEYLDTSNLTTCYNMFKRCTSLVSINTDGWNTSNVTTMQSMFAYCSHLTTLNIGQFNMTNVTNIRAMFDNCKQLTTIDVSNWDTSNVTDMYCTFYECNNLTSLNVSNWDVSNVTDMYCMFSDCTSLTSLDVSNWNTSQVTSMVSMFHTCSSLTQLDVSNFDTSKVTDMYAMFYNCASLTQLDVSNFDTGKVTDMYAMFCYCSSLTQLDVSDWNTRQVTDMGYMFSYCNNLTTLDLSNWNTSNVTNMEYMFCDCTLLSNMIMNNSDYNSVNKIISQIPTRTTDSMGTLNIVGVDDVSQVDIAIVESKYWTVVYEGMSDIVPVQKSTTLRANNVTEDSSYNNKWTDIQNINDEDTSTYGTLVVTGTGQGGFVKDTVTTIFDIDNDIPDNAIINNATLTIRAKSSAATNLYMSADVNNDSSKRVINEQLMDSTSATNYTVDVTDYVDKLDTLALTYRTVGSSSRTVTVYDIRVDTDYTVYEASEVPEIPEGSVPVDYSIALRPISSTQDSGYNNSWTNIANAYDTDTSTSGTIIVTGSSQSGFKRKYVDTLFNFDNPIPANATINSAVLTIRAKQSSTTNLNIVASIGNNEVIGSTLLSSSAANYTADIANYIKNLNQLNINLTSAATSNRTFTLYDVRIDVNYTAYEMPKPTYTVVFQDWDGFVFKTEKIEEGSSATAPSNPTRTGYEFIGWDIDFTNVTSNLTVTAQYREIEGGEEGEGFTQISLGEDLVQIMSIGDQLIDKIYIGDYLIFEGKK